MFISYFFSNKIKYQKLGEMILKKRQSYKCIDNNENLYQLKVGETRVLFEYSNNNKTFKECMLNILNKKNKKG